MTTLKTHALVIALIVNCATPAFSEVSDPGQISWDTGGAAFSEVLCGFSGNDFIMSARSEDMRLRLGFNGDGTIESIDFSDISSVELSFTDAHSLSGQSFARYRSMGEMGEIEASAEGAAGTLTLRPGSVEALDTRPDGILINYNFACTGEIF